MPLRVTGKHDVRAIRAYDVRDVRYHMTYGQISKAVYDIYIFLQKQNFEILE